MRRLAVVLTSRPSWAKLQPVCEALAADPDLELDLIACSYATTHSRGGVLDIMKAEGWIPRTVLHAALDANTGETSALTTGLLTIRLAGHFASTQPDGVIVNHDRHETLAASIAASYQNIPILHLGGGELSGQIDQKVRYANTALADWHCVSTDAARSRLLDCGVPYDRVATTGCPSIDVARKCLDEPPVTRAELDGYGTGASVDPQMPFTIVMQHPVTTQSAEQAVINFRGAMLEDVTRQTVAFWPGGDSGHDEVSKWIRHMEFEYEKRGVRFVRSLPPRRFLRLLSQCALAVGNSSALIREGSYFGIKRSMIGDRQQGRAWTQEPSTLYGDGYAAPRIAALCRRMVGLT